MQHPEWPGERQPTQWDVHDAYWTPEVSFLQRYKAALLLSQDAAGSRQYLDREGIKDDATRTATDLSVSKSTPQYTYPMVVLSDLPVLPDDVVLDHSHALFLHSFKHHLYLDKIAIPAPSSGRLIPPYLRLALACVGRTLSRDPQPLLAGSSQVSIPPEQLASNLCHSAMRLWGVMLEIDNREARLIDSILAGSILATYGMLTANPEFWDLSSAALAGTTTMARRVRLRYADLPSVVPDKPLLESNLNANSLLMSYLFLVDVVHTAHVGTIPCLSTSELFLRLPSSPYYFKPMYACLTSENGTLPVDVKSEEDSLLLLTAIASDIFYAHHTFSGINHPTDEAKHQSVRIRNPYVPLSAESEALRHKRNLDAALTRWNLHFGHVANANTLSLFYFCRLIHALPAVLGLPRLAGYAPAATIVLPGSLARCESTTMTDEGVNFAWQILDNVDASSEGTKTNVSIWLPVVLFHATLTVWYQLREQTSLSSIRTGTLRTLRMFRAELERLPWPCCIEMCLTLDRLMERHDDL